MVNVIPILPQRKLLLPSALFFAVLLTVEAFIPLATVPTFSLAGFVARTANDGERKAKSCTMALCGDLHYRVVAGAIRRSVRIGPDESTKTEQTFKPRSETLSPKEDIDCKIKNHYVLPVVFLTHILRSESTKAKPPEKRLFSTVMTSQHKSLSRAKFLLQLKRVRINSTKAEVQAILGKPDFVGHSRIIASQEFWFYGCSGPRKIPTLGSVYFDKNGLCAQVAGGTGQPPSLKVIPEKELRQALVILDETPNRTHYDPGMMIRIANRLQPLGKTKILAAVQEYERVIYSRPRPDDKREWRQPKASTLSHQELMYSVLAWTSGTHPQDLYFLLRTLFDVPRKGLHISGTSEPMPVIPLTARSVVGPAAPAAAKRAPRFPVILADDIPFLERKALHFVELPQSTSGFVPFVQKYGKLRTRPLRPSDRPWEVLEHFAPSPQWLVGRRYQGRLTVGPKTAVRNYYGDLKAETEIWHDAARRQILYLLAPIYSSVLRKFSFDEGLPGAQLDAEYGPFRIDVDLTQWDAIMQDVKQHPIRWNAKTNQYERRVE